MDFLEKAVTGWQDEDEALMEKHYHTKALGTLTNVQLFSWPDLSPILFLIKVATDFSPTPAGTLRYNMPNGGYHIGIPLSPSVAETSWTMITGGIDVAWCRETLEVVSSILYMNFLWALSSQSIFMFTSSCCSVNSNKYLLLSSQIRPETLSSSLRLISFLNHNNSGLPIPFKPSRGYFPARQDTECYDIYKDINYNVYITYLNNLCFQVWLLTSSEKSVFD